jgi:3-(3-hydroxy-phenyl)propionate hydroxylase
MRVGFRAAGLLPRLQDYFAQMKYKPKPFFREGFVLSRDGKLNIAGRLLPQPLVELPDRSRKMLDELLGRRFCLLTYGSEAERFTVAAARLDLGLANLRVLAILPNIYNPCSDCDVAGEIAIARDHTGEFGLAMPSGGNTLLLIRPDRYVAAATLFEPSRVHEFAEAVKAMVAQTYTSE